MFMEYIQYEDFEVKLKGLKYCYEEIVTAITGGSSAVQLNYSFERYPGVLVTFRWIDDRNDKDKIRHYVNLPEIKQRATLLALDYISDLERVGGLVPNHDGLYFIPREFTSLKNGKDKRSVGLIVLRDGLLSITEYQNVILPIKMELSAIMASD